MTNSGNFSGWLFVLLIFSLPLAACGVGNDDCGLECDADACEHCLDGECVSFCAGEEICDGEGNCVLPSESCEPECDADACEHCLDGECVSFCASDEICESGSCEPPCPGDLTYCQGECVDLDTDPANCGVCGNECAQGESCELGSCEPLGPGDPTRFDDVALQWPIPLGAELTGNGFAELNYRLDYDVYNLIDINGNGLPDIVWPTDATGSGDRASWGYPGNPHWRVFLSIP